MRAVGHRDVAGERRVRLLAAVQHRRAVDHLGLAVRDRGLDRLDVEDDDVVLLGGGHFRQRHAFLGIVAGRERVEAVVIGIDVVQIAADHHLPGDLHRLAIDRGEDVAVLVQVIYVGAVVLQRHAVFAVAEQVAGLRVLLQAHAMHGVLVRQLEDLVGLHHVATHARHAGVGLVVHVDVATVVVALGERHVRVVQVAVEVGPAAGAEEFPRLGRQAFGEYLQAFVGLAPAGGAAAVEHRDPHQLAHRRHADDAQLAALSTREEPVVFVELARCDVDLGCCIRRGRATAGRRGAGRRCRSVPRAVPVAAAGQQAGCRSAGRQCHAAGQNRPSAGVRHCRRVCGLVDRFALVVTHVRFLHWKSNHAARVHGLASAAAVWSPSAGSTASGIDFAAAARLSRLSRRWIWTGHFLSLW